MALKDNIASTQQNSNGYNIGMLVACGKDQELFDIAVKNTDAKLQTNNYGYNMVMLALKNGLDVSLPEKNNTKEYYELLINKKVNDICKQ